MFTNYLILKQSTNNGKIELAFYDLFCDAIIRHTNYYFIKGSF